MMFIDTLKQEIIEWCRGRTWLWRLPVLVYLAFIFPKYWIDPMYSSIFNGINLGVHELGHFVFGILGCFISVLGGTILELAVPIIGMFMFYSQRDYFAITFAFGWLGTVFFDISRYAADARSLSLPLVSPGGGETVIHDWEFILSHLGLLNFDKEVGMFFKLLGIISMLVCVISGTWMIYLMITLPKNIQQE